MTEIKTFDGELHPVIALIRTSLGEYVAMKAPRVGNTRVAFFGTRKHQTTDRCSAPSEIVVSAPFAIEYTAAGLP